MIAINNDDDDTNRLSMCATTNYLLLLSCKNWDVSKSIIHTIPINSQIIDVYMQIKYTIK